MFPLPRDVIVRPVPLTVIRALPDLLCPPSVLQRVQQGEKVGVKLTKFPTLCTVVHQELVNLQVETEINSKKILFAVSDLVKQVVEMISFVADSKAGHVRLPESDVGDTVRFEVHDPALISS